MTQHRSYSSYGKSYIIYGHSDITAKCKTVALYSLRDILLSLCLLWRHRRTSCWWLLLLFGRHTIRHPHKLHINAHHQSGHWDTGWSRGKVFFGCGHSVRRFLGVVIGLEGFLGVVTGLKGFCGGHEGISWLVKPGHIAVHSSTDWAQMYAPMGARMLFTVFETTFATWCLANQICLWKWVWLVILPHPHTKQVLATRSV